MVDDTGGVQLLQLKGRTADLLGPLEVITGVDPQQRPVQGDHHGTSRAGETRNPFPGPPTRGDILARMGIGSGDDPGIDVLFTHDGAQRLQAFGYRIHSASKDYRVIIFFSSCVVCGY
ncbi:hypothetical protein SDC9_191128 [bioreactor metagenome]|uniref:Uncharacterized protein n=1 Tax=bioreactor metagenome TaxID=1076179 RepID=A0A645HX22_9ZZZZ